MTKPSSSDPQLSSPGDGTPAAAEPRSARRHVLAIVRDQPEDSSLDDILRELAFERMVQRGLADADGGRTLSTEALRQQRKTW